jgi:hypothetical protein
VSTPEPPEAAHSRLAYLLPVIGAPLGMGAAIFASFAISGWRVTHSVIVQVEPQWVAGEPLAARVQVFDGGGQPVPGARVEVALRRGEERTALATLHDAAGVGAAQGRLRAPAGPPGPAQLELDIIAHESFRESVPLEIVASRPTRRGTYTVSGSTKNYADDTDAQPEALKIALRPLGRLVAGFENTLVARVTDNDGKPRRGPVEILLLDGEFGPHKAGRDSPAPLVRGETDGAGLIRISGLLASDVVRFEVRALPAASDAAKELAPTGMSEGTGTKEPVPADKKDKTDQTTGKSDAKAPEPAPTDKAEGTGAPPEPKPVATRKFRMVSFAGAVSVDVAPTTAGVGDPLTIKARGLRPKRAVFVDMHGPDGAWVDTLDPPVLGNEPPRAWSSEGLAPGVAQLEAYHFANAPGESAAIARVSLGPGPGQAPPLAELVGLQRARLDLPRVEKDWSRELEDKHLGVLAAATLTPDELELTRTWLLGTLPVEVLGPTTVLTTRGREEEQVAADRRLWAGRVRLLLYAGGGLFLLVCTLLIVRSHSKAAERLHREMQAQGPEVVAEMRRAQRTVLLRAIGLLVTLAAGLVLTAEVLDKLFWQT